MLPPGLWWLPKWHRGKEPICQCRRHKRLEFDPWVGKIPWKRAWQPTPVFLPRESHGQNPCSHVTPGYSPWGNKELDTTEHACIPGLWREHRVWMSCPLEQSDDTVPHADMEHRCGVMRVWLSVVHPLPSDHQWPKSLPIWRLDMNQKNRPHFRKTHQTMKNAAGKSFLNLVLTQHCLHRYVAGHPVNMTAALLRVCPPGKRSIPGGLLPALMCWGWGRVSSMGTSPP